MTVRSLVTLSLHCPLSDGPDQEQLAIARAKIHQLLELLGQVGSRVGGTIDQILAQQGGSGPAAQ